ncbi:hypothetical protein [Nocardia sp. NPDC058633]|uniref:hypothetical protein n=1 Tax=Nocardia sp. NPDC058633 TaxID=3346568 RepID=UPI0036568FDC
MPDIRSRPAALISNDITKAKRSPSLFTTRNDSHIPVRMPAANGRYAQTSGERLVAEDGLDVQHQQDAMA